METTDLFLHPVRMRIVHALSGDRTRTTSELCELLTGVPRTSVYRHVGLLVEGGVLEVAGERRVHGAVERHYRLRGDRPAIGAGDAASMTIEDHRRGFTAAVAVLLAEFNAYLDRPGADPAADSVGYRQGTIWLTPGERAALIDELRAVLARRTAGAPAPGRRPHLLSPIFFPSGDACGSPGEAREAEIDPGAQ